MNKILVTLCTALLISSQFMGQLAEKKLSILPAPVSSKELSGDFTFNSKSRIIVSPLNEKTSIAAEYLAALVKKPTGLTLTTQSGKKAANGSVLMTLDTAVKNIEGYELKITPKGINIKARTAAGLFYAVQTIRQLMPPDAENAKIIPGFKLTVPACEISDAPAYAYRGALLDVARHMFPMESIKKFIDVLALHKINRLQLHLTDDQGWRIEIKKYPELSKIGAYRNGTVVGHARTRPVVYDNVRYGGIYTQDELKDLVAYAGKRFITIIPEIEMPGHGMGALATYPKLSCTGGPFEVRKTWGIEQDVFCAGNEETFDFLENVLTEVMSVFPSEYIHIGGDECPKVRWEKCPLCQQRIKELGLKDEKELQSYFVKRIEKFITSKGRRMIGWDEILEGGLPPEATVMSWRGIKGGIEAAQQNHDVIMTPNTFAYLDYFQCEPEGQPLGIGGYLPLEKVYSFNPAVDELTAAEKKHIIGVQGNIWTEYIPTPEHLEYMAFPRIIAIAETGWTPVGLKNFDDFVSRLGLQKKRYEALNLNYFKGEYRDTRAAAAKK